MSSRCSLSSTAQTSPFSHRPRKHGSTLSAARSPTSATTSPSSGSCETTGLEPALERTAAQALGDVPEGTLGRPAAGDLFAVEVSTLAGLRRLFFVIELQTRRVHIAWISTTFWGVSPDPPFVSNNVPRRERLTSGNLFLQRRAACTRATYMPPRAAVRRLTVLSKLLIVLEPANRLEPLTC